MYDWNKTFSFHVKVIFFVKTEIGEAIDVLESPARVDLWCIILQNADENTICYLQEALIHSP
jgi:hypothetical protein